jgi:hypothetical protein
MNVSGCMFCKHAEGNKINKKMKKYILNVAFGKGEQIQRPSTASCFRSPRLLYQNLKAV